MNFREKERMNIRIWRRKWQCPYILRWTTTHRLCRPAIKSGPEIGRDQLDGLGKGHIRSNYFQVYSPVQHQPGNDFSPQKPSRPSTFAPHLISVEFNSVCPILGCTYDVANQRFAYCYCWLHLQQNF